MTLKKANCILAAFTVGMVIACCGPQAGPLLRQVRYWATGAASVDGMVCYVNPDDTIITRALVKRGVWEPLETAVLCESLKEGDTFVDVGANIGYYTLLAAKRVGPKGRVIAFEPEPTNFAILKRNVEANGLTNVILEQKALSNQAGTLRLYIEPENKGGHKVFQFGDAKDFVEVEAVRLDDYLKTDRGRIDFVKIDTEGAEGAILEGMQDTLRTNNDVRLLVEFFPMLLKSFGYDAGAVLSDLQSLGFEIRDVNERTRSVTPTRPDALLARHKADRPSYTNLLLLRTPAQSRPASSLLGSR